MPRPTRSRQRPLPSPFAQSSRGQVRVGPLAAIPDLVQELGASPRRVFASAGVSLRELLNRGRLDLACQMLDCSELAVGDIASALQYRDANAFSRAIGVCTKVADGP